MNSRPMQPRGLESRPNRIGFGRARGPSGHGATLWRYALATKWSMASSPTECPVRRGRRLPLGCLKDVRIKIGRRADLGVNRWGAAGAQQYGDEALPEGLKALDLPRVPFHALRHSAASLLAAQGLSLRSMAEVLGQISELLTPRLARRQPLFRLPALLPLQSHHRCLRQRQRAPRTHCFGLCSQYQSRPSDTEVSDRRQGVLITGAKGGIEMAMAKGSTLGAPTSC
jgi:hypothetical protein